MGRPMQYEIELRGDGSVDRVLKDRRLFAYDPRDTDDAIAMIQADRRRPEGEVFEVWVVEPGGRRAPLRTDR